MFTAVTEPCAHELDVFGAALLRLWGREFVSSVL